MSDEPQQSPPIEVSPKHDKSPPPPEGSTSFQNSPPQASPPPQSDSGPNDHRRVIVGNLLYSVKQDELKEFLLRWGPITNCRIPIKKNGRSKGVAIVDFENIADAEKFVAEQDQQMLFDRKCYLKFGNECQPTRNNNNDRRQWSPQRHRNSRNFDNPRGGRGRDQRRRYTDSSEDDYPSRRRPMYRDRDDYFDDRYDIDRRKSFRDRDGYSRDNYGRDRDSYDRDRDRERFNRNRDYYRQDRRRPRDQNSYDDSQ